MSERDPARSLELPVVVRDPRSQSNGCIRFEAGAISTSGVLLRTDVLLELGEVLSLELQLPDGRNVCTLGRITGVMPEGGRTTGMEMQFVDLSPDDRDAIAKSTP